MQRKSLVAWILLGVAVVLGWIGRAATADWLYLLSGFCFLAAAGIAISLLPWWGALRGRIPPMPALFPRAGRGEWDPIRGEATARKRK